jgi:hypothetical protein
MTFHKCVLCDQLVIPEVLGDGKTLWYGGHNPAPLRLTGKCCRKCNETKVIPTRLAALERRPK